MAVHFSKDRMDETLENHMKWWRGELDRPLVRMTLGGAHPVEKRTPAPILSQATCTQLEWSPEQIIDALDEQLGQFEFIGDGYPSVCMDCFGPGVAAAFCGARIDNSTGAIWFMPQVEGQDISEIHAHYDPNHPIARRIKDIYRVGMERWQGSVVMTMPDLGGVMDIAASLCGTQNLLIDLYDEPEEVLRLRDEIEIAWYEAYADMRSALGEGAIYSDWNGLLCSDPSYILQCDFSYMIGNDMFREFVLDTLRRDTEKLTHTIYHLDGVGQLNHLDSILTLDKLNAVQWVYGSGKQGPMYWLDVYRKIRSAGKEIMIIGSPREYMDTLSVLHGTPYTSQWFGFNDKAAAEELINAR
jgi:hypothetical protein